jgi:hypothetical protein
VVSQHAAPDWKKSSPSFIHPQWAGSSSTLVASRQLLPLPYTCNTDRFMSSFNAAVVWGILSIVFPLLVKGIALHYLTLMSPSKVLQ